MAEGAAAIKRKTGPAVRIVVWGIIALVFATMEYIHLQPFYPLFPLASLLNEGCIDMGAFEDVFGVLLGLIQFHVEFFGAFAFVCTGRKKWLWWLLAFPLIHGAFIGGSILYSLMCWPPHGQ